MKRKEKLWYIVPIIIVCLLIFLSPYLCISIKLNGPKNMELNYKENYEELGAKAKFLNTPLNVQTIGTIDTEKLGNQEIIYQVKNQLGIIRKKKRKVSVIDKEAPKITLTGGKSITLLIGEEYKDPGYTMIDNYDGDISNKVKLTHNIDTTKEGTYEVVYEGKDQSGNQAKEVRQVIIKAQKGYLKEYDNIDNTVSGWWTGNKKDGVRPLTGAGATEEKLKPYDAYYLGNDEKIVYLTFDEGSNDTYMKEIVDVLNKHDVKATFFLCKNYIKDNPELMKLLVETGHSVGNHTHNHETMAKYATEENYETYLKEIQSVEETFYEITGHSLDKVYREPRGEWSYRSLQLVKDLGYKTYFWSAAYNDFSGDLSKEGALTKLMQQKHNGAIYLIHPKNKGNYEAMEDFIKEMKKQGYSFGLVKDIK